MSEMTREEIEEWRHRLSAFWLAGKTIKESQEKGNALCDLALSALTARSEGFREGRDAGLEEAAKCAEEMFPESTVLAMYDRGPNSPPGNNRLPVTGKLVAIAIRALSPRETDAKVGQGWVPIGEAPRQVAWIDNDARYVGIIIGQSRYLLELPPPPERP